MQKNTHIINNVSATTAVELKAELAQHVEQFEKTRASLGKQSAAKRPDKKQTVWSRQNKGVNDRNQRDKTQQLQAVEGDVLARSREQLERKARMYEAMRSGKYVVDEEDEEKMPLVDFDRKYLQERELEGTKKEIKDKRRKRRHSSSEDEDDDNDPWVEFEDEFGRTRIVRRSELPAISHQSDSDRYSDSDSDGERYPMPRPKHAFEDAADRTNMSHYEADREIRSKGVGFYQFSKDEQERQEQMDKLNKIREETENARQSQASASSKRKQLMAQNAEKIRARRAALQAKKHQLKPEQIPQQGPQLVNEDSVTDFLKSMRQQVEK